MAAVTLDPPPVRQARPRRRTLLVAGGATAAAAATTGFLLLRDRDNPAATPPPTSQPPPSTPTTPTTSTSAPPPTATRRWSTKVSDYYPDIHTAGGVIVAIGQEDRLHAIDPGTGEVLWTTPTTLLGHVEAGRVYAAEDRNPVLRSLDPRTGATRWSYKPPFSEIVVRVTDTGAFACFGWNGLRARDAKTGAARWAVPVDIQNGLASRGALVVAASETALTAMAADTGKTRWTYRISDSYYLAVGDRQVFAYDSAGVLHAISAATGEAQWRSASLMLTCTPVPVGDTVYVGGGRGEVLAIDAATGTRRWASAHGADCVVGHADGTLQVSTGDAVAILDATDGATLWTHAADVDRKTPPRLANGIVYIGTRAGTVEALTPPGGARAGS